MNWLVSTALRFRVLVVAAAIALLVVGVAHTYDHQSNRSRNNEHAKSQCR